MVRLSKLFGSAYYVYLWTNIENVYVFVWMHVYTSVFMSIWVYVKVYVCACKLFYVCVCLYMREFESFDILGYIKIIFVFYKPILFLKRILETQ